MNSADRNIFLEGEIVYLRKVNIEKDVYNGDWHQWFNDKEITKYLVHGIYPNDKEEQARITEEQLKNKSTLMLTIVNKSTDQPIGVITLKTIDLINRTAEIGMVLGFAKVKGAAIESIALLTQHGFDRLNLVKIYAGQHIGLWKWVNTLETIGYKLEGYRKNMGFKEGKPYDIVLTGITCEDYYKLKETRGGKLIDSFDKIYARKRKENIIPELKNFLEQLNKNTNEVL